ncbi:unnamed protein product [Medioppia subpectinata]|uniref:Uncharacterized protein n=1 Tax=Medioppia subpectinata TaxID=1979941 RepID=A0A7R9KQ79_9ACAR|nr:unnamed protein product [Medioppia subpectinata]CAG2107804.1 unnamed protein product [Medioppia subpectinata]
MLTSNATLVSSISTSTITSTMSTTTETNDPSLTTNCCLSGIIATKAPDINTTVVTTTIAPTTTIAKSLTNLDITEMDAMTTPSPDNSSTANSSTDANVTDMVTTTTINPTTTSADPTTITLTTVTTSATTTKITLKPASSLMKIEDLDELLANQMLFGDPKHYYPEEASDMQKYCNGQKKLTVPFLSGEFQSLYPNNPLVQNVGKVLAEEGAAYIARACHPKNTKGGQRLQKKSMAANMACREAKSHRDGFNELLTEAGRQGTKIKLTRLACVLNLWTSKTVGIFAEELDLRDEIKDYVEKGFNKIIKILEDEMKFKTMQQ